DPRAARERVEHRDGEAGATGGEGAGHEERVEALAEEAPAEQPQAGARVPEVLAAQGVELVAHPRPVAARRPEARHQRARAGSGEAGGDEALVLQHRDEPRVGEEAEEARGQAQGEGALAEPLAERGGSRHDGEGTSPVMWKRESLVSAPAAVKT